MIAMNVPSICIILVTYNMKGEVLRCLRSLRDLSYPHFRIVVVDNGSSDGTDTAVRDEFGKTTFIQTTRIWGTQAATIAASAML